MPSPKVVSARAACSGFTIMKPTTSEKRQAAPGLIGDPLAAMADFLTLDMAPGVFLAIATVLALIWANSSLAQSYHHILEAKVGLGPLKLEIIEWINDALMALFFLQVGLEIKREILIGRTFRGAQADAAGAGRAGWNAGSRMHLYGI